MTAVVRTDGMHVFLCVCHQMATLTCMSGVMAFSRTQFFLPGWSASPTVVLVLTMAGRFGGMVCIGCTGVVGWAMGCQGGLVLPGALLRLVLVMTKAGRWRLWWDGLH